MAVGRGGTPPWTPDTRTRSTENPCPSPNVRSCSPEPPASSAWPCSPACWRPTTRSTASSAPSDDAEADSRLRAVLHRVQAPATGRAVAIAGDLTAPRLGLGERHDEIAAGVGTVIHSAASVAFDLPIEEARAINVEGTRRVLDFAGAVPDLQRVAYVSTAYVAGDRRGTVYEDDRETRDVPQLLRALQARGRGGRALQHAAVDDRAPEHRRRREHDAAGRRPSTSSTGRCGPSPPAPSRCCPRAGARRSTSCRSTTSPTRSRRSRATPRRRAGPTI